MLLRDLSISRPGAASAALALVVGSVALRAWAGTRVATPWVNPDEIIYSQLGRSLYLTGHLKMVGQPIGYLSFLYPAVVGPPLLLRDVGSAYALLKVVQALVMSLTAVPVYLWARTLVRPWWAVVAAGLTLSIPGLAYSGMIMSEVAFYPVMLVAAWAMFAALVRPSFRNQALMLIAMALGVATRVQALVLIPIFATAVLAKVFLDRGGLVGLLRQLVPTLVVLTAALAAWGAYGLHARESGVLLGGYQSVATNHLSAATAVHFVAYHAADALLLTAVIPVCATVLVVLTARSSETEIRAYAAVAAAFLVWLVAEVGVFASRYVGHLAERNLLPLAPILFVGFVVWLDRGMPRPRLRTAVSAGAAVALLAYLPLSQFVPHSLPDTFMLAPFERLKANEPQANLEFVLFYLAVPLVVMFLFVPRRLSWLLPLAVATVLVTSSVFVSESIGDASRSLAPSLFGTSKNWIDRAARGPVAYLYAGEPDYNPVYENIFWNRRIRTVFALPGPVVPGTLPQLPVTPTAGGLLRSATGKPLQERYVVASAPVLLRGTRVATAPVPKLALWHVSDPASISALLAGVDVGSADEHGSDLLVNGVMNGAAELVFYGCTGGTLRLTLASGEAADVTLSRNGRLARSLHLVPAQPQTVVLRARPFRASATPTIASRYQPRPSGSGRECDFGIASSGGALELQPLEFVRG